MIMLARVSMHSLLLRGLDPNGFLPRKKLLGIRQSHDPSVFPWTLDWEIYTAAIMTDTAARDLFIGSVKKYAAAGTSNQPFGDWYETIDGRAEGFRARPVAGGHLDMLLRRIRVCRTAFLVL
ncbi:hypothetical protein D9615_000518 [Tricholomella constricta]|uniref:Glutaminase A central domain-containing protein n=1 Tax=Tricholomella constricta TaxID=117010 RepID=A0A8H5MC16_9AGAR|nr:hypothetical protein D9615_000518 [Tricholomella constricta]